MTAGLAVKVALSVTIGIVSIVELRSIVAENERLLTVNVARLVDSQRLCLASARRSNAGLTFLLTRDDGFIAKLHEERRVFADLLETMRLGDSAKDSRQAFDTIESSNAECQEAVNEVIALRRTDATLEAVIAQFENEVMPRRRKLDADAEDFVSREENRLAEARQAAADSVSSAITVVMVFVGAAVLLAALVAVWLTRALGIQIGTAVGRVQSSSAELKAAANEQASGARQRATAMNEISTTIRELLASSRQIAESSQRVSGIATQTADAARGGDSTVHKASDAIAGIRRQVDLVTNHMLDLGKKSQQIGLVLEIVSELADQTNILAINATIEAAGAGDAGKRFATVADEIRKLADRVAGSAKEIRALIEDVRAAVNTTVMATETGSKDVDSGMRHFTDVTTVFQHIADLVLTTTDAAREIELSTKQQSTAVEQVNVAIADVAQATMESETTSAQTVQTVSRLATLSSDLLMLVEPQAASVR